MSRIARNVFWYAAGDAGSRIITFLVSAYLARVLGPSSFGIVSIGFAVLGYLLLLSSPAIQLVETRNVAAGGGGLRERVGGVLTVRFILAVVMVALTAVVVAVVIPEGPGGEIVMLFSLTLLPASVTSDWYFQGSERFSNVALSRVLQAFLFAGLTFLLVRQVADVRLVPVAYLGGAVVAAAYLGWELSRSPGRPRWSIDLPLWRSILRENVPVGLSVFLAQQAMNAPPLVLAAVLSSADVGIYSAAARLLSVLLFADRLLNALFLPAVTRLMARSVEEVKDLLAALLRLILVVLLPAGVLLSLFAADLMHLVFGHEFVGGAPVLRILTVYALLTIVNSVFVCTLVGAGGERVYARIVAIGAVVLLVLLVALTFALGMAGAAGAVATAEAVILAWMVVKTGERVRLPRVSGVLRPLLAAPALAAGPLVFPASPLAAAALSLCAYSGAVALVRGIPPSDLHLLRRL